MGPTTQQVVDATGMNPYIAAVLARKVRIEEDQDRPGRYTAELARRSEEHNQRRGDS